MNSRRAKARKIAGIVSERVAEVTTPGLGKWDPAWELVATPSDRFMDVLAAWESTGSPNDLEAVEQEAEALVGAWREADRRYHEAHRAETSAEVPA